VLDQKIRHTTQNLFKAYSMFGKTLYCTVHKNLLQLSHSPKMQLGSTANNLTVATLHVHMYECQMSSRRHAMVSAYHLSPKTHQTNNNSDVKCLVRFSLSLSVYPHNRENSTEKSNGLTVQKATAATSNRYLSREPLISQLELSLSSIRYTCTNLT